MKQTLIIFSLLFCIYQVYGQKIRFLTELDGGNIRSGIECKDSTYLAIGEMDSFAGYDTIYCLVDCEADEDTFIIKKWHSDFYIVKFDTNGDTIWSKKFGGLGADWIGDIKEINDDFIITGYSSTNSNGNNDFYISRVDSEGDSIWAILLGGNQCDWGFSSVITSSQNIFSLGSTYSFGNGKIGSDDILLIKTSLDGETTFTKTYGDSLYSETGIDIIQTGDNNIVLLSSWYYNRQRAIIVTKINESGTVLWTKRYNGDYFPSAIIEDNESNLVITGTKYVFGSNFDEDLLVFKLNENGDSLWSKTYGELRENGYSINLTNDNNYISCGSSGGENGGQSDLGLFKISQSGDLIWQRTFDLSDGNEDWGGYVKQTYDNGFVIFGCKGMGGSFILKTDEQGLLTKIGERKSVSSSVNIYPNPFVSNLSINNEFQNKIIVKIYGVIGALITSFKIESGLNTYNLSYLNEGMYLYTLSDEKGNNLKNGQLVKTFANNVYTK